MLIWITGLPGSGKTTLAQKLKIKLDSRINASILHLDGDELRQILPFKVGYSSQERLNISNFYAKLALKCEDDGCVVVCSFVSLFHEIREELRNSANYYLEIFLNPSFKELKDMNKKSLYTSDSEYLKSQFKNHQFPNKPDEEIKDLFNESQLDFWVNYLSNLVIEKLNSADKYSQ